MSYSTRRKKRFPFAVVSVNRDGTVGSTVRRNTTFAKAAEYCNGRINESGNTNEFGVLVRPTKDIRLQRFGLIPTATALTEGAAGTKQALR